VSHPTTREFIDACLKAAPPGSNKSESVSAALIARSAGMGIEGFHAIRQDLSGAGHDAFQAAWRRMMDSWDGSRVRFAVWLRKGLFPSQVQPVAQAANQDDRFRFASIVSETVDIEFIDQIPWFLERPFLHAPDPAWLRELEFLQVILGSEDKIDSSGFPRGVRRILQPHGIDIPLHNSIVGYGAGIVFDFVLCPSLNPQLQSNLSPPDYKGLYPPDIVEHSSATVTGIPAGYPKLDKFLRAAKNHAGEATKIVYHLSSWWLETSYVRSHAARILGSLLERFPERTVVFRPMPKNIHEPEIVAIIDEFRHHPRFQLSSSESYVEDYLEAAILIHHRSSSADIFAMATGRPVLLVRPPDAPLVDNPYGTVVRNAEDVVDETRRLLATASSFREANLSKQATILANPGSSIEYVLNCIQDIAEGKSHDDWLSLPLYRNDPAPNAQGRFLQSGIHAYASGVPFRALAREMVRRFPRSRTFNFLASVGLKRAGHPGVDVEQGSAIWLESLECLARCFAPDWNDPPKDGLATEFDKWMALEAPQLVSIAVAWMGRTGSVQTQEALTRCLSLLPFLDGPESVGKALQRQSAREHVERESIGRTIAGLNAEIGALRISAGVDSLTKGDPKNAAIHFRRAHEALPSEAAPWVGLAHCAIGESDAASFENCLVRLKSTPSGRDALPELLKRGKEAFPKP